MKILVLFLFTTLVFANTPEQIGFKIATKIENANDGYVGEETKMTMTLIDAHGTKVEREMTGKSLEVNGDGDKSISIFHKPLDVKGTKMLTWSHKDKDDDQWLYLPSLRRVKRINSRNKSASFMGSEFSYEDLGSQEKEKFKHFLIKEAKHKEHGMLWIMERKPIDNSAYSKQKLWISQNMNNPLRIEYYDRKGELLKVANFSNYKSYKHAGKNFYRASKIHMKNLQTKKESIMEWSDRKLGTKFEKDEFDKDSLR